MIFRGSKHQKVLLSLCTWVRFSDHPPCSLPQLHWILFKVCFLKVKEGPHKGSTQGDCIALRIVLLNPHLNCSGPLWSCPLGVWILGPATCLLDRWNAATEVPHTRPPFHHHSHPTSTHAGGDPCLGGSSLHADPGDAIESTGGDTFQSA